MAISVGDKIPGATVKTMSADGIQDLDTTGLFAGKKSVLFSVPGAFTPTCSAKHLPGYVSKAADIKAKGVDQIICMAVNDVFVMAAWAQDQGTGDAVQLVADGNGEFAKALGLDFDGSNFGMGARSQRFAAIVEDGVVKVLNVEAPGKFEVSDADSILAAL